MTPDTFREMYKCDPIKMIDLKALMGDSSDNIPGVKGIGEKTAINLIEKYGSLQNLYDNIDSVTGKTKEKLLEDKDNAFMSYDIATIYREVPIPFSLDDCKYQGIKRDELFKYLEELEMPSLIRKYDLYDEALSEKEEKKKDEKPLVIDDICNLDSNKDFSIYVETRGEVYSKSELLGIGIYDGEKGYFISPSEIDEYRDLFNSNSNKYTYDYKKDLVVLNPISNAVVFLCFFEFGSLKADFFFFGGKYGYPLNKIYFILFPSSSLTYPKHFFNGFKP